jgi:predicted metal-dependent phosphoesterase TrpH
MGKEALNIGDLHIHTYLSDGQQSPKYLLEIAKSRGLCFLAFTDHDDCRAYSIAQRLLDKKEGEGLILLTGAEINTILQARKTAPSDHRHILILGIKQEALKREIDYYRAKQRPWVLDGALKWAKDNGGVVIAAHPQIEGRSGCLSFDEIRLYRTLFDGIEIYNGIKDGTTTDDRIKFAQESGLSMLAGSDAHSARRLGTEFATELTVETRTPKQVLEAISSGNCRPYIIKEKARRG